VPGTRKVRCQPGADTHAPHQGTDDHAIEARGEQPNPAGPSPTRQLSAAGAAKAGLRHVVELTASKTGVVTSVEPAGDGWVTGVEIVESRRVPPSADTLALYETKISMEGRLVSCRRAKRYSRG
jgi:Gas vesicle synthesis protein GvpO